MSSVFTSMSHSCIDSELSSCVDVSKQAAEQIQVFLQSARTDSFKAKQVRSTISLHKERIERIYESFGQNFSDDKEMVFDRCSVPVLQLYVAKKRAEDISEIMRNIS